MVKGIGLWIVRDSPDRAGHCLFRGREKPDYKK
jgi:hypothetical protein